MRILYNARINTLNHAQPQVNALAIDGERIVAIGSDADLLALARPEDVREDMQGKTIWPGLIDAHLHLSYYAMNLERIDCETPTLQECLQRVKERAAITPPGSWILGNGWNQNLWSEGYGTAQMLDEVAPNHPVYLTAKSWHASWGNSQSLQLAGIQSATPDPVGGQIQRAASGQPTGILFENAMQLIDSILPELSAKQVAQSIAEAQPVLWAMGLTGVHDYDGTLCFAALQLLQAEQRLHLRVLKGIPMDKLGDALALGLRSGFGNDYLRLGSVKLFADGALGPRTAAMLQPYEGEAQYAGFPLMDSEQIFEISQRAISGGISVATHAIGDRANHEVIIAYSQLRALEAEKHLPHLRHRIEHLQLIHPDDLLLLAKADIIASMQPTHATSDMLIVDQHWGSRSAYAYAWRSAANAGVHLAFGSDAPVESPNPFLGLHAAVTRRRPDGSPSPQGWHPEQRLTLKEALQGFTTGAAYAAGLEQVQGQLTPNYFADLIVLDQDPFSLPPQDLHTITPRATMVGGRWVYER